jgi:hypothetical protein
MRDNPNQPAEHKQNEMWLAILIRYICYCRGIRLSIIGACLLLAWDAGLTGSFLLSFIACPIWFIVSVIKNAIQRPGWGLALTRIAFPPLILWLVMANDSFQRKIAEENAPCIITACEQYHTDNGKYPKALVDLVPQYLPSVPLAKYCLMFGEFFYWNMEDHPQFLWYATPPFGRKIYTFDDRRWGYID